LPALGRPTMEAKPDLILLRFRSRNVVASPIDSVATSTLAKRCAKPLDAASELNHGLNLAARISQPNCHAATGQIAHDLEVIGARPFLADEGHGLEAACS
jgi:hypothetical protein